MEIVLIIISLLLTALFSSLIVAYTYSNKILLNLESKKDNVTSYTLQILSENPRLYISTLKAGNTLSLVVFSFCYLNYIQKFISNNQPISNLNTTWIIAIITAIALVYTFSKFIPQTLIKPYANKIILNTNLLIRVIITLFAPVTNPFLKLSDWYLRKILKLSQNRENQLLSISELGSYITKQIETVEEKEKLDTELQILKNALAFTDVTVKRAMVPKIQIESINSNESIEYVIERFIETGYSRLLVYQNNEDNIIGYIHIFEILENPTSLKNIIYPIETVNENQLIKDLFKNLSVKHKSIAKVVNDNNQVTGIITMEDIIEELFGKIDDEHDSNIKLIEKEISENKFIISTRFDISYLNKKFNLNLTESNEYSNLQQYIYHYHPQLVNKGDYIIIENNQFKILSVTDKKIEIVEIIKN